MAVAEAVPVAVPVAVVLGVGNVAEMDLVKGALDNGHGFGWPSIRWRCSGMQSGN